MRKSAVNQILVSVRTKCLRRISKRHPIAVLLLLSCIPAFADDVTLCKDGQPLVPILAGSAKAPVEDLRSLGVLEAA